MRLFNFDIFPSASIPVKQHIVKSKVSDLLAQANTDYNHIIKAKKKLLGAGISNSKLPNQDQLIALAYLGNYERDKQVNLAENINHQLFKQITDANHIEEVSTPVLRLLNSLKVELSQALTLQEMYIKEYDKLDSLELLTDSDFYSVNSIHRPCWDGKIILKAEVSSKIDTLMMMFDRYAFQEPQLHCVDHIDERIDKTVWSSQPFYMDEGDLYILAKQKDQVKYKHIPMKLTGELPNERFNLC